MMNKKYKEEMENIHASERRITETINKINMKSSKRSYEFIKKFALGAVAMMMVSVTSFATYMVVTGKVSDFINEKVKDEAGQEATFQVPQIDIDSEDADKMNKDIKEKYEDLYKQAVENIEKGLGVGAGQVFYNAYENEDVLSVVSYSTYYASVYYSTYNINTVTGKKVENNELLEMKGLTENEIEQKVVEFLEDRAEKVIEKQQKEIAQEEDMIFDETDMQEMKEYIYETIYSDKNKVNENTRFYLNNEGHLCMIITENVFAAAGEYERLYDIEANQLVEEQWNDPANI